ncbi:MAG: twitching motility protein PilT [Lachnospiraceae bacterium]|nr:twitching motility protein PilT [Lachnospiraceae bacterium]
MVMLITGEKGKGKTRHLIDKVNTEVKKVNGSIVFLDKSTKHMFELNNRIRLIDVSEFELKDPDEFAGFVSGIISQDHDLEQMYIDNILKLSQASDDQIEPMILRLEDIGKKWGVDFVIDISKDEKELSEKLREKIIISL